MGLDEMMEGEEKKRESKTELQGTPAFIDGRWNGQQEIREQAVYAGRRGRARYQKPTS